MSSRMVSKATVALLLTVLVFGFAGQAGAASNPDYTVPPPSATIITRRPPALVTPRDPAAERQVKTAVTTRPVRSELPITGSDVTELAVIGLGLGLIGIGVLVVRRRLRGSPLV